MSRLTEAILAEKASAIERHLARVAERLPEDPEDFEPSSDSSDAVILHLWQAVQLTIDTALSACLHFQLGTPPTYGDAFRRLAEEDLLEPDLAERLARAAGFRNVVVHAYERLDLERIYRSARDGPSDLRAFLTAMRAALREG
jgi:uncharacterized protein YutE (UPF0331/DUF86 family)